MRIKVDEDFRSIKQQRASFARHTRTHITNSIAMEDIRLAASLFFEQNLQLKNNALNEFSTLTQTKPGWAAKTAFDEHLRQRQPECSSGNLAAELDADRDGYLTFEDFLVYRYWFQTRPVCGHCKAIVKLVFYTCLHCFADKSKPPTYDLCTKCYLGKKFSHPHNLFLNNYAMVDNVREPPKDASIGQKVATTVGVGLTANAVGKGVIDAFLPGSGIGRSARPLHEELHVVDFATLDIVPGDSEAILLSALE